MFKGMRIISQSKLGCSDGKKCCNLSHQLCIVAMKSTAPQFLPSLPVPSLKHTLEKYLRSAKPVLTETEYCEAQMAVKKFYQCKEGQELQKMLEDKAKNTSNWLYDWWMNNFYLTDRLPVVVHSSPALIMPRQKFRHPEMYIGLAAKVISAALCYKILIDDNDIPAETIRGEPLDMSQNLNLFGSCRIPESKRDVLYNLNPYTPPNHIIVVHNNHFFRVPVLDSCGYPISLKQIEAQLQNIVSESKGCVKPVGILTSEHRDKWACVYKDLAQDNKVQLEQIQTALFLVCLDGRFVQQQTSTLTLNLQTLQAMKILHGGGIQDSSGNRWFDKTLQFVIGCTGEFGLLLEPTAIDVQIVMNLLNYIMDVIEKKQLDVSPLEAVQFPQPIRLDFSLNNRIEEAIKTAEIKMRKLVDDTDILFCTYTGYGMNFIKSHCLSPDAFIQMAVQLAFYRVHCDTVPTYEFASTRRFCHGRTDTIRTPTLESVHFVHVMVDDCRTSDAEKVLALEAAIVSHIRNIREAVCGHGIDRHMFGLKMLAIENGLELPDLLVNNAFLQSSNWRLYTGQVRSPYNGGLCLGPATYHGYGIGYNPRNCNINFGLTAYKSSPCTNLELFHEALMRSLTDMHTLLVRYKSEEQKKGK